MIYQHLVLHNSMASQWEMEMFTNVRDNETEGLFFNRSSYVIEKQCLEQWLLGNSHGN